MAFDLCQDNGESETTMHRAAGAGDGEEVAMPNLKNLHTSVKVQFRLKASIAKWALGARSEFSVCVLFVSSRVIGQLQ
jgi:hypothetical protein